MSWENSHTGGGESMEFDIFAKHFYCGIIHMLVAVRAFNVRTFSSIQVMGDITGECILVAKEVENMRRFAKNCIAGELTYWWWGMHGI